MCIRDRDRVIVHIETIDDPSELIAITQKHNKEFALAINPETSVQAIEKYIHKINQITVMAVHPGFGGQKMLTDCLEKIKDIKDLIQKNQFDNQDLQEYLIQNFLILVQHHPLFLIPRYILYKI